MAQLERRAGGSGLFAHVKGWKEEPSKGLLGFRV